MKCQHCGKDYEPLRATSKFCSPSCRVLHNREESFNEGMTRTLDKLEKDRRNPSRFSELLDDPAYAGPPQHLKEQQAGVAEALQERFASKPEPTVNTSNTSGPLLWPLGMDKDTVMARLARIKSYNLWASRQPKKISTYSRSELSSILQRSGYDPQLSRFAFD